MSRVSLQVDFYMNHKDHIFVTNVVVNNMTWEIVVLNVISRPTCAIAELSNIAKIRKYKGLHEGHHFILMALEVGDALEHDMDCFIKEFACFSTADDWEVIYPCLFPFNF
jgi:hypothetical protein